MEKNKSVGFPDLIDSDDFMETRPMHDSEISTEVRINQQLEIIGTRHERIKKAIEMFWGHRDCVPFIQQLILNGDDADRTRVGFKQEILSALISLIELHKIKKN